MRNRFSVAKCCCQKERPPIAGTYKRSKPTSPNSFQFNGSCQDSPSLGNNDFIALGLLASFKYAFRGFVEYLPNTGTNPPTTINSFITLLPNHKVTFEVIGHFDLPVALGSAGDIELRLYRLVATPYPSFCTVKDIPATYYNTIVNADWTKSNGAAGGKTSQFDITVLMQEVRTSAEYIADPDLLPLFEIRPAANWDPGYHVIEEFNVQGTNDFTLEFS